jgi:TatD DNase family protein
MTWIDVHTHLNFLEISPEQALSEAKQAGVERVITIGTEPKDHQVVLDLAQKYFPQVVCTLGIHPHEAALFTPEVETFFRAHLQAKEVVAVGEIGLDYYYNNAPAEVQKRAFRSQLKLAQEFSLPVEIHTRDAEADTVEILKEFGGQVRGIIHCFTGTKWLAEQVLNLGLDISFSGVVTFKKADELREVVKFVPLSRLHVETDAPFLAPMPHRGKKNVPAYVVHTAEVVAQLKGVTLAELAQQTQLNALRTFPKLRVDLAD